jgi:hypothetical protein
VSAKDELVLAETCNSKSLSLAWCGPLLLCDEEVSRIPREIGGVYLLQVFSMAHGRYAVAYAGKATDLLQRLTQHRRSMTFPEVRIARERLHLFFSAAPVPDAALRARIEAGLILRFRPPFNRQVPKATPVLTTLPPLSPI